MALGLWVMSGEFAAVAGDRPQSPVGKWLTQDGDGVVEIFACGHGYCGRIVGMSETRLPNGTPILDSKGQPQCGLTILQETGQSDTDLWQGQITNPTDGSTWNCEFWIEGDDLHLRGYVVMPLLGSTQTWHRYHGNVQVDCRMR